ncbi:MAG: hypothetical protein AAFP89_21620 [Bacteroidota bacterium]
MNPSLKIVTEMPVQQLWHKTPMIGAKRERYLTKNEWAEILQKYPVEFVIANVGDKLDWIPVDTCFEVWKSNIRDQAAYNPNSIEVESYPHAFVYVASEWTRQTQTPIILLEKYH